MVMLRAAHPYSGLIFVYCPNKAHPATRISQLNSQKIRILAVHKHGAAQARLDDLGHRFGRDRHLVDKQGLVLLQITDKRFVVTRMMGQVVTEWRFRNTVNWCRVA